MRARGRSTASGGSASADVPDPDRGGPGDAVVRVTRSAICGSDLHFFHGKAPIEPGDVLGHEAVGVVEAVGPGVERFSPGDRVVVAFNIACGACWFCRGGRRSSATTSANLGAGAFGGGLPARRRSASASPSADVNLLRVPDDMDDERALFVGDILTTGLLRGLDRRASGPRTPWRSWARAGRATSACRRRCARRRGRVFALDLEPARLALAAAVGAVPVDVAARHPASALAEATGRAGRRRRDRGRGHPDAFETRRRHRAARRHGRGGGHVRGRDGRAAARRLLGARARPPVRRHLSRSTRGGSGRWPSSRPARSTRCRWSRTACRSRRRPHGYELFDRREATKVVLMP